MEYWACLVQASVQATASMGRTCRCLEAGAASWCVLGKQVNRGSMPAVRKIMATSESIGHFLLLIETWKLVKCFCKKRERTA